MSDESNPTPPPAPTPTPKEQAVAFIAQALTEYGNGATMQPSMRQVFISIAQQAMDELGIGKKPQADAAQG